MCTEGDWYAAEWFSIVYPIVDGCGDDGGKFSRKMMFGTVSTDVSVDVGSKLLGDGILA